MTLCCTMLKLPKEKHYIIYAFSLKNYLLQFMTVLHNYEDSCTYIAFLSTNASSLVQCSKKINWHLNGYDTVHLTVNML